MKVHHVKSARPCSSEKEAEKRHAAGVEVEQPYYWWNESRGPGKRYSRYRPKRSQLTRTQWSLVYAIEEALELTSDSLELQNALDSGILVLRKLRWHYLEPAPGRLRTEANFRAKIERITGKHRHVHRRNRCTPDGWRLGSWEYQLRLAEWRRR